ncbi:putative sulfate exporter family transporter [Altererythrobacter indicus]|uniref:Putative sulfate exporter family transporter n=1 Tax=Altericroceibacterium indicum TaxID=374177 RepID=A0A845A879_9SPHN|nr:putative sulfate exporter family transporter [Altericroceibacterium indicum]MXP25529.1 putative sulfate exporter family transporter [Altericroceibacterium indicum]
MISFAFDQSSLYRFRAHFQSMVPGVGVCFGITALAYLLQAAEEMIFGKAWLEALVLAILIGTAIRSIGVPVRRWHSGIAFSARYFLEIAVVLLGASVSAATIMAAGPALLAGISIVVVGAIMLSFGIGRLLGVPIRMALLVACGNSICGNSAIAAVAPVIGADGDDVAASIAFTAVLGVLVVLGLPLLGLALGMSALAYGAFAGLTVYAVPQVIAAAAPLGPLAVQTGMLVKLVRVLMLGPVCLILSLIAPHIAAADEPLDAVIAGEAEAGGRLSLAHLVPWFILGFLALVGFRSFDLIPRDLLAPISQIATFLTVISMAALGLGVDLKVVLKAGGRVTMAVVLSLIGLGCISFTLLKILQIG